MVRALRSLAAGLLVALAPAGAAFAQDIQAFKPAPGTWNYLSVQGATVGEPGRFIPSLYLNYGRNPLVHRNAKGDIENLVIEDLTMVDLVLAIGLHERLEVGVDVPFGYGSGDEKFAIDKGAGLGDLRLMPKLVLLGVGEPQGFGLALIAPLSFPTGDEDTGSSSRHFIANPGVVLEYRGEIFRVAANAGYRWRPTNNETVEPLTVGSGVTFGAAGAVQLGTPTLQGIAEVYGTRYDDVSEKEGGPNPVEALGGVRVFTEAGLVFTMGAGAGIVADFAAPEFRVLAGLAWSPRDDGQPAMVALADAGDQDGDGVKNSADACPALAEDRDGFEDVDGCPDLDNDGDTIVDASDKCPGHGEDVDGFQDEDGCPDLDNDGDGLADLVDRCPSLPENRNGFEDIDGCPDADGVIVRAGGIELKDRVYFATDRDDIKAQSHPILDQLAEVLVKDPSIERLRIEGHTDNWGNPWKNEQLSKARAGAVARYLLARGVSPERLETAGFGGRMPIGDNRTEEGAAANRRVEFKIVRRGENAAPPAPEPVAPAPVEPTPAEPPAAAEPEPVVEAPAELEAPAEAIAAPAAPATVEAPAQVEALAPAEALPAAPEAAAAAEELPAAPEAAAAAEELPAAPEAPAAEELPAAPEAAAAEELPAAPEAPATEELPAAPEAPAETIVAPDFDAPAPAEPAVPTAPAEEAPTAPAGEDAAPAAPATPQAPSDETPAAATPPGQTLAGE